MVILVSNLNYKAINNLEIDIEVIKKLKNNNITTIEELWCLKRSDLKQIRLTEQEIKHIIIKLQLHSLDLNKKIYTKN